MNKNKCRACEELEGCGPVECDHPRVSWLSVAIIALGAVALIAVCTAFRPAQHCEDGFYFAHTEYDCVTAYLPRTSP